MTQKYILPHLLNAIFPPEEHARYNDNFATGNCELKKVTVEIAQRDGNVIIIPLLWTLNINS